MDLAGESIGEALAIASLQKSAVKPLRLRPEHSVKSTVWGLLSP